MSATLTALMTAIVAGATAASTDVATDAVKSAYYSLKSYLQDNYRILLGQIEDDPNSNNDQRKLEDQLNSNKALSDNTLIEKIDQLRTALANDKGAKALIEEKLRIHDVKVSKDVVIKLFGSQANITSISKIVSSEGGFEFVSDNRSSSGN